MLKAIKKISARIWHFFKCLNIYIGRDIRTVPPGSILLFPVLPDTLLCGLAGILTIKQDTEAGDDDIINHITRDCKVIQGASVEKVINQSVSTDDYLGGPATLKNLENAIKILKEDSTFEHVFFTDDGIQSISHLSESLKAFIEQEEDLIEKRVSGFTSGEMEHISNLIIRLKDASWALEKDILANIDGFFFLAGTDKKADIPRESLRKYRNINLLLNAIDNLEVRGRDSAGIQITFTMREVNDLDTLIENIQTKNLYAEWLNRVEPGDLYDGSIHVTKNGREDIPVILSFTYKKASVTGELGENGRYLRDRIRNDRIFQTVINEPIAMDSYMAHTRWASVGSITEENCHPINNFTLDKVSDEDPGSSLPLKYYPHYGKGNWSINAALNGDIDNYSTLRAEIETEGQSLIDDTVTTDTKIVPLQIERYLSSGHTLQEAFRHALNDFEGSHAIAMNSNLEPDKVFLALRGSGQALYIGLSDEQFIYSSELYGLIEVTSRFIKMNGESERVPGDQATKGQFFVLDRKAGGDIQGINALYYDGDALPISDDCVAKAEITTRDIDRKGYPHYLLKEIFEAPLSAQKTMRGKYHIRYKPDGATDNVVFSLGNDIVPPALSEAMINGNIKTIYIIGQGTAAVAGAAIAEALSKYLGGQDLHIEARTASELSGFSLQDKFDHALVIAVTQSGTTTDTNRAVAMAIERGAHSIAIVNRRQSDITHMTDGVFYTSDGRDIEMSVASTKAFYSQIIAGYILALYFAKISGTMSDDQITRELIDLEDVPEKMNKVIAIKEKIRESAWDVVREKKYWAVVGSGSNKVASDEIRIKLSELCYKTISSDIVENKKHIDLSSEPLIIVCAAGNPETVAEDIVKDVAIFKAHEGSVVVITDEDETRFDYVADSVIYVPRSTFPTSVILNTLAGHIWGYYAACSINEEGEFFKNFRKILSREVRELDARNETLFEKIANTELHKIVADFARAFNSRKNKGFFSSLSTEIAADMPLLFKYSIGKLPLEDFWEEFKDKRNSSSPLDMLDVCLGRAIDELSRPIDAIRHQAKTVTVGTSRKGEMIRGIIFDFLKDLDFSLENLTTKDGAAARRLQKALSKICGYTLYDVEKLDVDGTPGEDTIISIRERGGISSEMKSRVEEKRALLGTKRTIIRTGEIYAGLGKLDKAPIIIMPVLGENHRIRHILLLHVIFKDDLTAAEKKEVLGDKFNKIFNLVNEYNFHWDDAYLDSLSIEFLLGEGVDVIVGKMMKLAETDSSNEHDSNN